MKVLLLSRYDRLGASSRVRSYQYLPYLRQQGLEISAAPLLGDEYVRGLYCGAKKNWANIAGAYLKRIYHLLRGCRFDLIWIEKELFPWLPSWGERLLSSIGIPYIVDYDDAVFHRYDLHSNALVRKLFSSKINQIMSRAALVMAGNQYLAQRALETKAKRVELLPTVVDLARYTLVPREDRELFTIGWIGSAGTAHYLRLAAPALAELYKEGGSQVILVGSGNISLEGLPVECRPWSEGKEVAEIQNFDVGIMPLPDDPWERGKCGYKLIQYQACGRPVVASPVGVNRYIVSNGVNGFQAGKTKDWLNYLRILRDNPDLRDRMGLYGRMKVAKEYSLQVTAPRLFSWLVQVVYG